MPWSGLTVSWSLIVLERRRRSKAAPGGTARRARLMAELRHRSSFETSRHLRPQSKRCRRDSTVAIASIVPLRPTRS